MTTSTTVNEPSNEDWFRRIGRSEGRYAMTSEVMAMHSEARESGDDARALIILEVWERLHAKVKKLLADDELG